MDSWRTTYSGIVPADFLAEMSYEALEGRWRSWLTDAAEDRVFLVAESSGGVVGFAAGGPRRGEGYPEYEGELYAAYILQAHQRMGLGRRLFESVVSGLAERGTGSMLTWVLARNPSRRFYEAMGGGALGVQEIEIGSATLEEVAYGWTDIQKLRC